MRNGTSCDFSERTSIGFSLGIPARMEIENTIRAAETGVGAQVVAAFPELPALVLEYIDGVIFIRRTSVSLQISGASVARVDVSTRLQTVWKSL